MPVVAAFGGLRSSALPLPHRECVREADRERRADHDRRHVVADERSRSWRQLVARTAAQRPGARRRDQRDHGREHARQVEEEVLDAVASLHRHEYDTDREQRADEDRVDRV
jgi:hypothetical protein